MLATASSGCRTGDLESRETRVGHRHRDVESVRLVGADHCRERVGEVLLGGGRGEEVDILGGAIEEAVGLHGVAAGEAEPEGAGFGQRKAGEAAVELVHGRDGASAQAAELRPGNRDSQRRRTLAGRNRSGHSARSRSALISGVMSCGRTASTRTRS